MTARFEECEFYMVWTKKGLKPRKTHPDRVAATKEALRLAESAPGQKFIVLQGVAKYWVEGEAPAQTVTP